MTRPTETKPKEEELKNSLTRRSDKHAARPQSPRGEKTTGMTDHCPPCTFRRTGALERVGNGQKSSFVPSKADGQMVLSNTIWEESMKTTETMSDRRETSHPTATNHWSSLHGQARFFHSAWGSPRDNKKTKNFTSGWVHAGQQTSNTAQEREAEEHVL